MHSPTPEEPIDLQGSPFDVLIKLIVLGDSGSGKSCLMHQFIQRRHDETIPQTVGVEFGSRIVRAAGKTLKLQVWDTAGQERFRSVTRSYYRGAAGCLVVFDLTNRESFQNVSAQLCRASSLHTTTALRCIVWLTPPPTSGRAGRPLAARRPPARDDRHLGRLGWQQARPGARAPGFVSRSYALRAREPDFLHRGVGCHGRRRGRVLPKGEAPPRQRAPIRLPFAQRNDGITIVSPHVTAGGSGAQED